jgi:hypothetical protein
MARDHQKCRKIVLKPRFTTDCSAQKNIWLNNDNNNNVVVMMMMIIIIMNG